MTMHPFSRSHLTGRIWKIRLGSGEGTTRRKLVAVPGHGPALLLFEVPRLLFGVGGADGLGGVLEGGVVRVDLDHGEDGGEGLLEGEDVAELLLDHVSDHAFGLSAEDVEGIGLDQIVSLPLEGEEPHLGSVAVRDDELMVAGEGSERLGRDADIPPLVLGGHGLTTPQQRIAAQGYQNSHARSLSCEREDGDFGTGVEAHREDVAEAAVDVKTAATAEGELARCVALIADWEDGRREEGGLALAAMRVAGQDPSMEVLPDREVRGIRVVGEDHRWEGGIEGAQDWIGVPRGSPEVFQPDKLESGHDRPLVAEEAHAVAGDHAGDSIGNIGVGPTGSKVVIAQGGQGGKPAEGKGGEHAIEAVLLSRCLVGHEVAGDYQDVGMQLSDLSQRVDQVVLVDLGTHMQVADLDQGRSLEVRRQSGDGQGTMDEFDPVGLDSPCIEADAQPGHSESRGTTEESAASDLHGASCPWGITCRRRPGADQSNCTKAEPRFS